MKRTILTLILVAVLAFCLTACGCEHVWTDATCLAPKTCNSCGKTEGETADHAWEEATCEKAKSCKTCGETEGEALGHQWAEATCETAKTCSVCSKKEGEALGHKVENWKLEKEPTCSELGSESGVCGVCNAVATRDVAMLEHTPGEWQVQIKATVLSDGREAQSCTVCEKVLEERSYELPPFDIKPLKSKGNFKYDEFSKSWKYYQTYNKNYSDATESITIILFSEDNGTNIEDIELRAGLYWKDESKDIWEIKKVEFIVGDKIYACDMTMKTDSAMAYTFLASETSHQMLQDMATSNSVKAKISYTNGQSIELNVGSKFKGLCSDVVKYNMWDYYDYSYLVDLDTTTVR